MSSTESESEESLEVVPLRHYGRWAGIVVTLVVVAMIIHTLISKVPDSTGQLVCHVSHGKKICQPALVWRYSWNTVGQYLFNPLVVKGVWLTLQITFWAMVIGISLGLLVAIMRLSRSRLLSAIAWSYTWFFRGTPVLIQLFFWFAISIPYPHLTLGLPFLPVTFAHINSVKLLGAMNAAIIGLGLNEAAYFSEIARAGLISVDEGQIEAATSIGMTPPQTMRLVILPQAMRVIIPPTGNEVISMLKTSSLASAIGVMELTGATQAIAAANFDTVPLLIVASLWYLFATTLMSIGQFYVERHYARGSLRNQPLTPIQRLRRDLQGFAMRIRPKGEAVVR